MDQRPGSIMLATLGGQPQLITFALDALLAQGETIDEVIVLYLSAEGSRVNRALNKLSAEFVDDYYAGQPCRLRPMPIRDDVKRLPDIRDENQANATWEMLRDLMMTLKQENRHLHVCVSGGRRIMALLMMSVSLLQFSYRDKMWHIYTPEPFLEQVLEGAMMHAQPEDGVRLIQVPLIPLGTHFPALRALAQTAPTTVTHSQAGWLDEVDRTRCQSVVTQLTPRELETLQAFAAGLLPQDVANQMQISLNTVNTYKKKLFELCHNAWPEQAVIRYHHLREWFGPFFNL